MKTLSRKRPSAQAFVNRSRAWPAIAIVLGLLIFCVSAYSQCISGSEGPAAGELLRRVVDHELSAQSNDYTHWMYQVTEGDSGKEQVKLVVETSGGNLNRLVSVNGQPIPADQEKQENQRIETLIHNQNEQQKIRRAQQEDDRQTESLFKMLPDAVTACYGQRQGDLVEILFTPNPNFHASSHEAAVFHAMEGRIWMNSQQNRLAEIEGHLIKPVKFGGGLLGHLDQGGEFHVKQSEIAPGHWEITLMHVNMHGKALFFKTISVQQHEVRSNFQRVADNLTLAQAAEELQKKSAVGAGSNTDVRIAAQKGL